METFRILTRNLLDGISASSNIAATVANRFSQFGVPKPVACGHESCYVWAERSARLEREGYDRVALPVVLGAYALGTR